MSDVVASFCSATDYRLLPRDPHKFLVDELIPTAGLTNMYGKPKDGKTTIIMGIAMAIANGDTSWNGFAVFTQGPVMLLQTDTSRGELGDRIEKLYNHGFQMDHVHVADKMMIPVFPFDIMNPKCAEWLRSEIDRIQPVMVIIDTLRECHKLDENSSTDMTNVIGQIVKATMPAAVVFLSHTRKETAYSKAGGDDLIDDARGSSYVAGRMDNIIRVTRASMTWKGRAGDGSVAVKLDPETECVILDGSAAKEAALLELVVKEVRGGNPKCTQKAVVDEWMKRQGWEEPKRRTARRKVSGFLKARGWQHE